MLAVPPSAQVTLTTFRFSQLTCTSVGASGAAAKAGSWVAPSNISAAVVTAMVLRIGGDPQKKKPGDSAPQPPARLGQFSASSASYRTLIAACCNGSGFRTARTGRH